MNFSEIDDFLKRHTPMEEQALAKKSPKDDINYISCNRNADREVDNPQAPLTFLNERISFLKHERFLYGGVHSHPYIELVYVYSGRLTQWINDDYITLEQGDLCILDMNVSQKVEYCGEDDIVINCMMWKNYFDHTFFSNLEYNDLLLSFFTKALYHQKETSQYILFHKVDNERIHRYMKEALCEYYNRGIFYEKNLESYMNLIYTELLRSYKQEISKQYDKLFNQNQIYKILQYIQDHCQSVTLTEIAEAFHFNPSYLSRFLKKVIGSNFNDIVQEARLDKACRLLVHTRIPIEDIANEIGYSNINYFYRIFKQAYSNTPAGYRKEKSPYGDTEQIK